MHGQQNIKKIKQWHQR